MPGFATLRLNWEPRMLSILRIMVGLLYMEHGLAKILDFPHQPNHAPYALFTLNPGLQGLLELVGRLLLALGLFTRTVAFVLAGDMAVAYFMAHSPRGFFPLLNGGELAIVYCFVFLYLWVAGGGEWSLDRLRAPRARVRPVAEPGLIIIGYVSGADLRGHPVASGSGLLIGGGPGVRHCQGRSNRRPVPPCMCSPDLRRNCYRSCRGNPGLSTRA